MRERAFRCPSTPILVFELLLAALPGLAVADESKADAWHGTVS